MLHPSTVKETIIFKNLFADTVFNGCLWTTIVLSSPARGSDRSKRFYHNFLPETLDQWIGWGFKIIKGKENEISLHEN